MSASTPQQELATSKPTNVAPIGFGYGHAQVPKADVFEFHLEFGADSLPQITLEIEALGGRPQGHGGMKEPGRSQVDPPEKLPIALQLRIEDIVIGLAWEALQQAVQVGRAENHKTHQPVVIGLDLRNPRLFAHRGAAAVATDGELGANSSTTFTLALGSLEADPVIPLTELVHGPAIERPHRLKLGHAPAKDRLGGVLRQPLVLSVVIGRHQIALEPVIAIAAEQTAIGGQPANSVFPRNDPRRAQLILRAPEMKMLHRPLGQILTFRDRLRLEVALNQKTFHAPLTQFDRQSQPDRPPADDGDLRVTKGALSLRQGGPLLHQRSWRMEHGSAEAQGDRRSSERSWVKGPMTPTHSATMSMLPVNNRNAEGTPYTRNK